MRKRGLGCVPFFVVFWPSRLSCFQMSINGAACAAFDNLPFPRTADTGIHKNCLTEATERPLDNRLPTSSWKSLIQCLLQRLLGHTSMLSCIYRECCWTKWKCVSCVHVPVVAEIVTRGVEKKVVLEAEREIGRRVEVWRHLTHLQSTIACEPCTRAFQICRNGNDGFLR